MKPIVPKPQRCAIYTRNSTEHNLDLEFNSLDAQREACEAYIKCQASESGKARRCEPISARTRASRRVRRALAAFGGAVGKDRVSRVWCKQRSLAGEPIVRLILNGTVLRVRLAKKSTAISLLVALGIRQDWQKFLLAVKTMGGESEAAWRTLLDDLVNRGLFSKSLHNLGHNGFLNLVFVRRERAAQERTRRDGTSSDGGYTFG
jgi:Transposase, Mutator family